ATRSLQPLMVVFAGWRQFHRSISVCVSAALLLLTGVVFWEENPSKKGGQKPSERKADEKHDKKAPLKVLEPAKLDHWTTLIPPTTPMGMDIYESGTYTAKDQATEPELFDRVRKAVALEWAQRVKQDAIASELKPAKVGTFEALFFESMIDARIGNKVH